MNKADQLNQVYQDLSQDSQIESGGANLVPGDGNPLAKILFIGEAPGQQEDLQKKPFVGASGQILSQLLASVFLDRSDVYITNIVKYRPANNRDPTTTEISNHTPYLQREIEVIEPQLVVTLGRYAANFFMPELKITQAHGQIQNISWQNRLLSLLPLYHPAVAL